MTKDQTPLPPNPHRAQRTEDGATESTCEHGVPTARLQCRICFAAGQKRRAGLYSELVVALYNLEEAARKVQAGEMDLQSIDLDRREARAILAKCKE